MFVFLKETKILKNLVICEIDLQWKLAGHRCGCMLAKQMGGYSDGCALSGEGRVVSCYQK